MVPVALLHRHLYASNMLYEWQEKYIYSLFNCLDGLRLNDCLSIKGD